MDEITRTVANNISTTYPTTAKTTTQSKTATASDTAASAAAEKQPKGALSQEAATFERSSDTAAAQENTPVKKSDTDRSAIVAQLKADMEKQTNQLLDIVRKTLSGQGGAVAIATDDDSLWKTLAKGDFTVDAATKAQAQEDISEDGYWGVDKTSDRILDFAKALSGNDPEKADQMLEAFKKGYEEATKTWGDKLPDITKNTYDAVLKKFDDWKNSGQEGSADTQATDQTAANASAQTAAAQQAAAAQATGTQFTV